MPRRVIIVLLVILIIAVVLGTGYLIIQKLRGSVPASSTPSLSDSGSLSAVPIPTCPASAQVLAAADPNGDPDHDGLTNAQELLWGTDPCNPDTDHDGFTDGQEVKAGHNPTIPAPNDKLPPGFVPGQNLQPLPAASTAPIAVDQFFQDNLDLTLGTKNYTSDYDQQVSADKRTAATLVSYVNSQPVASQLPTPTDQSILQGSDNSPTAIAAYLAVIGDGSIFSNQQLFSSALDDLFSKGDTSSVTGLAAMMRAYRDKLIQTTVPPNAVALDKLLLGYSELLANSFDQMGKYNTDKVRALVAVHQWQVADAKYVPLIEQEITRLEAVSGSSQAGN